MLDSWQGWWINPKYDNNNNNFVGGVGSKVIEQNHPNWGFKKMPFEDTCLWIMQLSVYNHTWGNYDCLTKAGYVCEINVHKTIVNWV